MLGGGGVGKSSLTIQLVHHFFQVEYDPTIENSFRQQMNIDGAPALLEILDTAGQEEYIALRDQYIYRGEGFMLVYSITSRASFEELDSLYQSILNVKDTESWPVVVVGNKCDLEKDRDVSTAEGKEFAAHIGAPFFEASAKSRLNVEDSYYQLVREVRKHRGNMKPTEEVPEKKKKRKGCIII
jgi:GTPase KRas protein